MTGTRELRFGTYNTRRNLPAHIGGKRGESRFLGIFVRTLLDQLPSTVLYGRSFSMPGCGVADLVVCRAPADAMRPKNNDRGVRLDAYEAKMSDWRRGLQQAYRYRYWADRSFVVLPEGSETQAVENRERFRQFGVGLLVCDPCSRKIVRRVVASATRALNPQKRALALERIRSVGLQLG